MVLTLKLLLFFVCSGLYLFCGIWPVYSCPLPSCFGQIIGNIVPCFSDEFEGQSLNIVELNQITDELFLFMFGRLSDPIGLFQKIP